MQRCMILIDGSNFYFKLKELGLTNLLEFDFSLFVKNLVGHDQLVAATYYVGAVKVDGSKKVQQQFNNQRKLLHHLKKCGFNYFLGYLLKSNGVFHEKGVDVKIVVDILIATYENIVDKIILVSSDTDFLPAIKVSREKGKIVEYVGFKHRLSMIIRSNCNSFRFFSKQSILIFFKHI